MKRVITFLIVVAVVWGAEAWGQIPEWEPEVALTTLPSLPYIANILSAVSDGHGQHILLPVPSPTGGTFWRHYLLGSNGVIIYQGTPFPYPPVLFYSGSLASFNGDLYMVVGQGSSPNYYIVVYKSIDGGANWTNASSGLLPNAPYRLSAYADVRGVHIVWDGGNTVRYIRQRTDGTFTDIEDVSQTLGGILFSPKVVTSPNKLIVTFLKDEGSGVVAASRDYDFLSATWAGVYKNVPNIPYPAMQQSVAILGDFAHIAVKTGIFPYPHILYVSKRDVTQSSSDWTNAQALMINGRNAEPQWGVSNIAGFRDTLYTSYINTPDVPANHGLRYRFYDGTSWSTTVLLVSPGGWQQQTLSAWNNGVFFFYQYDNATNYMRRKVKGIEGIVSENSYWTGNNWISDRTDLLGNITVTMKPVGDPVTDPVLTLFANKELYVQSTLPLGWDSFLDS